MTTTDFLTAWRAGNTQFTLQTSGSTGAPKPITLTRAQMEASARLTGQTFGLHPGDRALVCLNTSYIAGVMMLVRGEVLGLELTIVPPAGNPLVGFDPATTQFDFAAFVPLQLQTILADAGPDNVPVSLPLLNRMKAILIGGAATSAALENALQVIESPVYATYGMTETVSHIAIRRLNGPQKSDLFTVLPGVRVGTDERGCLHITAAATNHERIQTNDDVELIDTEDTVRFRLLGRADSIINTGGVKVQPEAVEAIIQQQLLQWHLAPRLFITGLPDERLGQRVVLFLENQPLATDEWIAIQTAVRDAVGPYAVPKAWFTVDRFSETATGKVDRKGTVITMVV
ncbi:AMP-binding protein [Fibrella sp. HMF5335]|uniref:AMP-binding protein n=1 Tax=Fibrella rubiginis TaxID=2817060 RepID=A0A939K3E1_9BACT|nr:AMP-binding protein [Fibrella rubiginis]MBO0939157.1 AMP-binding protein [Fibrella rubiginis]